MHIANTRIFKNMVFQEKQKRGGQKKKEKQVFCLFCLFLFLFCVCVCVFFFFIYFFSPAVALVGIHIPGKSHTFVLNQKRLPTCATSTATSGCVQSFNHLHFQLEKKKEEEEYKHN